MFVPLLTQNQYIMKNVKGIFLVAILLALSPMYQSCKSASSSVVSLTNEKYAPTNPDDIQIFASKQPEKDFIELAKISTDRYKGVMGKNSDETINSRLREKASKIGGHAIINLTEDFASVSGVVIRYKE